MHLRPTVLVVDDDPSLRMLSRVNLELDGFDVREAATAADARAAVAQERPDVVLLDVNLGAEASDDFLDELRAAGIPVVLVTGTADIETYRARANAILGKPFLPSELVDTARRLAVG
jgi:DNA-binding NtrC family response regulator